MAYRVSPNSARPDGPSARRSRSLSRNTLIAGVSLGAVSLAAAGVALFGTGDGLPTSASFASDSRSALKVALVDPAAPVVARRDPRVAVLPEAVPAHVAMAVPPHPGPLPQGEREQIVPLPAARPAQQIIEAALIPLPRERIMVASADSEATGSLGMIERGDIALAYANVGTPSPSPHRREEEEKRAAKAGDFIGPLLPAGKAARASIVAAPKRPLTPHNKLYGGPVRVASLTPDSILRDSMRDTSELPRAPYDKQTAVYVISDRKVYMPDGRALEAHSGLGDKMDDPRFVKLRMHGATPPHVYDLTMRESLFHGVEAIRMTPIGGDGAIFGRAGILAHTYMLGPNGQSNGCVSFKNYDAFLDAFKAGKIARLAVIAKLD
ncbi:MAG: tlde1 domain-containing protein [Pseudolabrys sp.]